MADLTPKISTATDTTAYDQATGKSRPITRVFYMLGALGPFKAEFDEGTMTDAALRKVMDEKAAALRLLA